MKFSVLLVASISMYQPSRIICRRRELNHNRRNLSQSDVKAGKYCTTGNEIAIRHLDDCVKAGDKIKTGCSEKKCEKTICSEIGDSFCCNNSWDKNCIESAKIYCTTDLLSSYGPNNMKTKSRSSCYMHSSREKGCDNKKCENIVCDKYNSLCCISSWDWDCVLLAMDHCCLEEFDGYEGNKESESESEDNKLAVEDNDPSMIDIIVMPTFSPITVTEDIDISTHSPSQEVTHTPTKTSTAKIMITNIPTEIQSNVPTTHAISGAPTVEPTMNPTNQPTFIPSKNPTYEPTAIPSATPSNVPSNEPSNLPSNLPSNSPSDLPSTPPSDAPSSTPTETPVIVYCTTMSYHNRLHLNDCVIGHESKGCSNTACEMKICDNDSFCCHSKWDTSCADSAKVYCNQIRSNAKINGSNESLIPSPIYKSTCFSHSSLESGCDNKKCQNYVCQFNSFCCTSSWSFDCVILAIDYCCLEDFD